MYTIGYKLCSDTEEGISWGDPTGWVRSGGPLKPTTSHVVWFEGGGGRLLTVGALLNPGVETRSPL